MVGLGQELKMSKTHEKPLYKKIIVILCKEALEKTPNIQEMVGLGQKCKKHANHHSTRTLDLYCAKKR